jgi:hypothetical protein
MQPISTTPLTQPESNGVSPPANIVPDADEREKQERIARYSSPEFAQQLLDHMREAVRIALLEAQEQPHK